MAKIGLVEGGFTLIPEGVTTFKVESVDYDPDFGKMKVNLVTKSGDKHTEQFMLTKKTGEVNEGAIKAFSYFAKTALNNYDLDEIDDQDLVGCYITATVSHEEFESNKTPGRMLKSVRLNDYQVAAGFGSAKAKEEPVEDDEDLDDFLDE